MRPYLHYARSLTGPAQSQLLGDHSHLQLRSLHGAHGRCTNQNNLTSAWKWTYTLNTSSMDVTEIPIAGSLRALYLSLKARGVRVRRRSSPPIICTHNNKEPWNLHLIENSDQRGCAVISPWYRRAWWCWGYREHAGCPRTWWICGGKTAMRRVLYCCLSPLTHRSTR